MKKLETKKSESGNWGVAVTPGTSGFTWEIEVLDILDQLSSSQAKNAKIVSSQKADNTQAGYVFYQL